MSAAKREKSPISINEIKAFKKSIIAIHDEETLSQIEIEGNFFALATSSATEPTTGGDKTV